MERGHELRTEPLISGNRQEKHDDGSEHHEPSKPECNPDYGMIELHQRPADRVLFLAVDLANQYGVSHPRQESRPK
jgi:hypothetical protein